MFQNVPKIFLCDKRSTFASFPEDDFHFGDLRRHITRQAQRFRRVVLFVFANRIVRAASGGGGIRTAWQAWHFVTCDQN